MSQTPNTGTTGKVPDDVSEVSEVIQRHHKHFIEDTTGETVYQQLENERSIRREYSGRVLFELLQNALDRAESKVHVQIRETASGVGEAEKFLVVANDGVGIRMDPEYDYDNPPEVVGGRRPDFNALCSLHTSNKSPEESVGNKGIGFRSVFWLGDYVRVWSRCRTSGWWGIEMHLSLDKETWRERLENKEVRLGSEEILESMEVKDKKIEDWNVHELVEGEAGRPSFHFPLPLVPEENPVLESIEDTNTAIVVPILPDKEKKLLESVREIKDSHLHFVGLFEENRDIEVDFRLPSQSDIEGFHRKTWPQEPSDSSRLMSYWRSEGLKGLAEDAEHEVSEPGSAIAWPERNEHPCYPAIGNEGPNGRIYGYLPTLVESPFGIDIQGDFQLRTDRTGLSLNNNTVGQYNRKLLKAAAELHLYEALRHAGTPSESIDWSMIDPDEIEYGSSTHNSEEPRSDFWCLMNPSYGRSEAADVVVEHVQGLLFEGDEEDKGCYETWVELAETYFGYDGEQEVATYRSFWLASQEWLKHLCPHTTRSQSWDNTATAFCDALRESGIPTAPIIDGEEIEQESSKVAGVPLPERRKGDTPGIQGQSGHSRTLFLRESGGSLSLPTALQEAERAVTSFSFPSDLDRTHLAAREFNRWEVLSELRQLPNSLGDWEYEPMDEDPERASELQRELIEFGAELYRLPAPQRDSPHESEGYNTGWRVREDGQYAENARSAGRSIATLYLPNRDGLWEPARQLSIDQIDRSRLPKMPEDVDTGSFLRFLGVAPEPPENGVEIILVEGGTEDGVRQPREIPPRLESAGQGRAKNPTFGQIPTDCESLDEANAWRESIAAAWKDWMSELIKSERELRDSDEEVTAKTSLIEPLRDGGWYPVGTGEESVSPPDKGVAPQEKSAIAPKEITILSRRQQFQKILWNVYQDSPDRELLRAVGAIDGVDIEVLAEDNADPAFRLLKQLRRLEKNKDVARQPAIYLFDRIIEGIVKGDDEGERKGELVLLTFEAGSEKQALAEVELSWVDPETEDVWIAPGYSEREQARNLFPSVPLSTSTRLGSDGLEGYPVLSDSVIDIQSKVKPEGRGTKDALVEKLEDRLSPVIPHLLSLAEADPNIDVDPETAARNWQQRKFRHVEDAWIEYTMKLSDSKSHQTTEFKNKYNDALLLNGDSPTVIFDTPSGEDSLPPLAEFGEPLAGLLLEGAEKEAGSVFARALGAYESERDMGGLDRFLKKKNATHLVEAYERKLLELDEQEKKELYKKSQDVFGEFGLGLEGVQTVTDLCHLTLDDVVVGDSSYNLTEGNIQGRLRELDLTESQELFRPEFYCKSNNRSDWQSWFDRWGNRLKPYLVDLVQSEGIEDMDESRVSSELKEFVKEDLKYVRFDPRRAVVRWLIEVHPGYEIDGRGGVKDALTAVGDKREIPAPDDLEDRIRDFSPLYEEVSEVHSVRETGWNKTERVEEPNPNEDESGTFDPSDAVETMKARGAVGREAEEAFLKEVSRSTAKVLEESRNIGDLEGASRILRSPVPEGGATEESLNKALEAWKKSENPDDIAGGLHISDVWDGAGYDVLGLEKGEDGTPYPVRYEVKGLPQDGTSVKVHITSNEISVYRQVCHGTDTPDEPRYEGDWRLMGVEQDGSAVDFSPELDPLPELLDTLRSEGYDHEGFVLCIER